jgi:hypothetical protein
MHSTLSNAAIAGRLAGTAARGLIRFHQQVDWAEVGQIVVQGLQLLVVAALLAGRYSRRAWGALVPLSERLGKAYVRLLLGTAPASAAAPAQPRLALVSPPSHQGQALKLEGLTQRQLMVLARTRRKLSKRQLVAMVVAA